MTLAFEPAALRRFAALISRDLGIMMPDSKLRMLHGRLQRRLHQLGLDDLDAYEARLHDPLTAIEERQALIDLATTNKTDFFREPQHFDILRQLLPRGPQRLRVWCAGCSTGEEVYTLAMVLADHGLTHPGFDFEILGTDVSARVLRHAAHATYGEPLIAPVPADLRHRYLRRGVGARAGFARIAPELRAKVRFGQLNFMAGRYDVGQFDVVFFRNVMIYFDRPTQERVVRRLCEALVPGGHLFLGHSESVLGMDLPLELAATSVLRRTGARA